MTKQEIYDELKADGAKLKAVNFVSLEQLESTYFERFGRRPGATENKEVKTESVIVQTSPVPVQEVGADHDFEEPNGEKLSSGDEEISVSKEVFPALRFTESGWCPELSRCYFTGTYRPNSRLEYEALRRYAAEEL